MYFEENSIGQNYSIEIVRDAHGDRFYINLLTFCVPCGKVAIGIQVEGSPPATYSVEVMEGGQRLLLDGEAACQVVEALSNDLPVTLYLANRQTKLIPANFGDCFRQF